MAVEPEIALFRAVLLCAFQDACAELPKIPEPVRLPEETFKWRKIDGRRCRVWVEGIAFDWEQIEGVNRDGKPKRRRKWREAVAEWREVERSKRERKKADLDRNAARGWLTDADKPFREVCLLAALDHEYVERKVKEVAARKWAMPLKEQQAA